MVPLVASPALIDLSARTESDYGLDATSAPIFHVLPIPDVKLYLWGVPADQSHDQARFFSPLEGFGSCFSPYPEPCATITGAQSSLPPIPYLENPTECGVPLTTTVDVEYYSGDTVTAAAPWPSTTGCDQLAFNPSLTATPTTTQQPGQPNGTIQADAASGLDVDLTVPQTQSPFTPSPSEIRATTVTLPEGFSINPNAADGKVTCSDQQGAFGTRAGATCPEHSKVGTVDLDSSALPQPIPGAIYLGDPQPGNKYRIFLTADGFGTHVKLAGRVDPESADGAGPGFVPRPAAIAVPGVQPPLLRLGARSAGNADAMRHLSGGKRIRALGRKSDDSALDQLLHRSPPARTAGPVPVRFVPSIRRSTPARRTTPPGGTRRSCSR